MLLEDDETQTPVHKTLKRCSRTSWNLLKYYPRPPCAPSLIKSRIFSHTTIYLLTHIFTFLKFLICIHAGNPRVPPRVLASGPKPYAGKNKRLRNFDFKVAAVERLVCQTSIFWFHLDFPGVDEEIRLSLYICPRASGTFYEYRVNESARPVTFLTHFFLIFLAVVFVESS